MVGSTLRRADAVISNSEVTRRGVEDVTGPRERLDDHPSRRRPDHRPPQPREPTLVTVAHLVPHKGQATVIRALARCATGIPACAMS